MSARSPRQQTLVGIGVTLAVLLLSGVIALVVEFRAVAAGGNSTISEIVWSAWAAQPGAFVAVLAPLVFAIGFLSGHFFWQAKVIYDAQRAGVDLDLALQAALVLRGLAAQHEGLADWHLYVRQDQWKLWIDGTLYGGAEFLRNLARDKRA